MAGNDSKNTPTQPQTYKPSSTATIGVLAASLAAPVTVDMYTKGNLTLSNLSEGISAKIREVSIPKPSSVPELISGFWKGIEKERADNLDCRSKKQKLAKNSDGSFECVTTRSR